MKEVQEIVQSTLDRVRTFSQTLHPAVLEEAGLEVAVRQYLKAFEKQNEIRVIYETSGEPQVLDQSTSIHTYRVLQEALNNVARHSKADRASVRLRYSPQSLVLEVEDGGVGLVRTGAPGMGLVSMRERAELVHGRLDLVEASGGGLLVRLTVPTAPQPQPVAGARNG